MDITLTIPEESMLADLREDAETVTDVFHRLMKPFLEKHADVRLNKLADEYRRLTPELQVEALVVLRTWQESKKQDG